MPTATGAKHCTLQAVVLLAPLLPLDPYLGGDRCRHALRSCHACCDVRRQLLRLQRGAQLALIKHCHAAREQHASQDGL